MRRYVLPTVIGGLSVMIQVVVLNRWFLSHYLFNIAVAFVIVATLQLGWRYALMVAVGIGGGLMSLSAVHGLSYPVALLATCGVAWVCSHKIFTTRSAASFVVTIAIASAAYGAVLIGWESIQSIFVRDRLHLDYLAVFFSALTTSFTHPILLSLLWRWMRWDRYERVVTSGTHG